MTVLQSHISWCSGTWNPTTGCTKVSAGCDHCYAEALTKRLWGGNFEQVKMHQNRLADVRKFKPVRNKAGELEPFRCFTNSMSDVFHEDIPDEFRHRIFEAIATMPQTVFQVLTKRPMTMRRYVESCFKVTGVPDNVWLGVSVEDNRVRGRIDQLRRLKDAVGPFTAFLSVEPLIGPCDQHDYTGMDWVLIGGESGGGARPMAVEWDRCSRDLARKAGAAVWHKQFGTWQNNPLYARANGPAHLDRVRQAIKAGERLAWIVADDNGRPRITGEKGGATLDGEILHELPPAFHALKARISDGLDL